jgi:hypothetical protein
MRGVNLKYGRRGEMEHTTYKWYRMGVREGCIVASLLQSGYGGLSVGLMMRI